MAEVLGDEAWVWEGVAGLPVFTPNLSGNSEVVEEFRRGLERCSGAVLVTPEYAHGIPGGLKNALDWVVTSGELWQKPCAVVTAFPAPHVHEQLREVLTAMDTRVVGEACVSLGLNSNSLSQKEILGDERVSGLLVSVAIQMSRAIEGG